MQWYTAFSTFYIKTGYAQQCFLALFSGETEALQGVKRNISSKILCHRLQYITVFAFNLKFIMNFL